MREDKKITSDDIENAEVRLKPLFGIATRIWLPAAYGLALAAILFCLLFLPGILKHGSYIDLSGTPGNAAVYVDGSIAGFAGAKIFVKSGAHSIELRRRGFSTETIETTIPGRLFGSLFFPRHYKLPYALEALAPQEELSLAYTEYSAWAGTGKPSSVYQTPLSLSEGALSLAETGVFADDEKSAALPSAKALAGDALAAAASGQAARDAIRAVFILADSGSPSPFTLVSGVRALLSASGAATSILWLSDTLPRDSSKARASVDTAVKTVASVDSSAAVQAIGLGTAARPGNSVSAAGIRFIEFSGATVFLSGEAPSGSALPYTEKVSSFAVAATETTVGQWRAFLAENPEWAPENKPALIESGLADESYLVEWNASADPSLPVTGVSWFAARSYCDWLSTKAGSGYTVTLPSEAMWETAAQSVKTAGAVWAEPSIAGPAPVASKGSSASGLADMLGNVWEWCSDSWLPYPALASGSLVAAERTVRGGSWANAEGSVGTGTRGGIAPEHASAFLGFRPVLVRK